MVASNPEMLNSIIEDNQRVLVIFALQNPDLFSSMLGGETQPKQIVALVKENPDMALTLAMQHQDEIVSFAVAHPRLIADYAMEYKEEVL